MPARRDRKGERYGQLTALKAERRKTKNKTTRLYWLCKCDCGREVWILSSALRGSKGTKSCGCLVQAKYDPRERARQRSQARAFTGNLETGLKLGRLTLLRWEWGSKKRGNGTQRVKGWVCRCDCGTQCWIRSDQLKRGNNRSCGCAARSRIHEVRRENFLGKKFGKLTVIKPSISLGDPNWTCACDCGTKTVTVPIRDLITGRKKSCGCGFFSQQRGTYEEMRMREAYNVLEHRSRNKNIALDLSAEEYMSIVKNKNCTYCGVKPAKCPHNNARRGHTTRVAHGLDRVDNAKGYTMGNVVPCCTQCNYAKRTMPWDVFTTWLYRTYQHLKGQKWIPPKILIDTQPVRLEKKRWSKWQRETRRRKKTLTVELDLPYFSSLITSPCSYCGARATDPPYQVNSIDRLDNDKGYEITNVVPACIHCNRAKLTQGLHEFIEWVKRAYSHLATSQTLGFRSGETPECSKGRTD